MSDETTKSDGAYENAFLNVGNKRDRGAATKSVVGRRLDYQELSDLYESNGFAKWVVDLQAEEMTRQGFDLEWNGDSSVILSPLENINTSTQITDALRWSRLYGGSVIVMLAQDGGNLDEPLNENSIRAVEQLRVYGRPEVSVMSKYEDPSDMRFGKARIYSISPADGITYLVHESRCLVFDGEPATNNVRSVNDGWGSSILQQCYTQVERFGMSHYWANALLERSQQAVHGIPDLSNILSRIGGEALVLKRIGLVDMARCINNTVTIDSNESYDLKATSLAGVADLIDRFAQALCAASGIPESLLLGKMQGGLSSTGKGDLERWYGSISRAQNAKLLKPLDRLVSLQMKAMGVYKDDYLIKFNPLFVMSEKELAEIEERWAKTFEVYYNTQALDSSEIRASLAGRGFKIDDVNQVNENEVGISDD